MLVIPRSIIDEVISHLKEEYPLEGCGVLIGKGREVSESVRLTNKDKSEVSYQSDPLEQYSLLKRLDDEHLELLCIYHSHPEGEPVPSSKDIALAYFNCHYMIVCLANQDAPQIRLFTIENGAYNEEKFETK
ncbi:MAG: M67 family metallopeptidase [Candidatus Schekmanbacteria bacterium]|nr:M67 family metallopeptidase [Candidatus Schekmanbacteria bacterium]